MDNIVAALLNLGIGGVMAAAVAYFLYLTNTKTIPDLLAQRDKDVAWAREQISQQRGEFIAALNRSEERWQTAVDKLCAEIAKLREDLQETRWEDDAHRKRREEQQQQQQQQGSSHPPGGFFVK